MTVVIVLICASILVAGGFLFAFLWAVRSGQYEDKYTPSVRMLLDEEEKTEIKEEKKIIKNKNKGRQNE
jgi:cbb3-type cytochrome oxidase maturation protein